MVRVQLDPRYENENTTTHRIDSHMGIYVVLCIHTVKAHMNFLMQQHADTIDDIPLWKAVNITGGQWAVNDGGGILQVFNSEAEALEYIEYFMEEA